MGEAQAHWTCAGYGDTIKETDKKSLLGNQSESPTSICGCGSVGRASDCHSEGRGFEPRQPLHVAVVQLVEHQIVALVVVDSSSTGHPIYRQTQQITFYTKRLYLV